MTTTTTSTELSAATTDKFRDDFVNNPALVQMQNAVTKVGVNEATLNHQRVVDLSLTMSNKLGDWTVANQKRSGRCWLFAILNLLRYGTKKELGVKEFEFSQNYQMYWDKLERANYFLTDMIEVADKPVEDRLVSFLLAEVMGDGGQWNMAVNLIKKHGVVPKEKMPETQSSEATAVMNDSLRSWLRQGAMVLRDLVAKSASADELDAAKEEYLAGAHRILTMHLGTPPKEFEWQWQDDEGNFHRDGVMTPQQFAAKYITIDLDEYVCLVDDPRSEHPKGATLTVEHLGNIIGGDKVVYLNTPMSVIKQIARDTIVGGSPVWFGCDSGPQKERKMGLWAKDLYDYSGTYQTPATLDKESRVRFGESMMDHAMVLVGVDVEDGKSRRWRVENSWGTENADKGFYTMDDPWFDEYVFEVAVRKQDLPADLHAALANEPISLPAWDPMGALA